MKGNEVKRMFNGDVIPYNKINIIKTSFNLDNIETDFGDDEIVMVGYNPKAEGRLSHTHYATAGALSGAASRVLFQPLDVLKIRFQLQIEPISRQASSKYQGIVQAVTTILSEEGPRAFWKGHVPAQVLSIGFGMAQYASFEILTYAVWKTLPESLTTTHRPLTHSLCGAVGGSIASAFVQPIDVIRTRFVAQGEPKIYNSMMAAVVSISQKEGWRGFYRGLVPAIAVVGPQMGLQFGFYSIFTTWWHEGALSNSLPGSSESLVCGFGAGFISKMFVHPFDVIKKRLQVQGFDQARVKFGAVGVYSNSWHCFKQSLKVEGLRGLYKGLTPSVIKASLVAGFHFLAYEQLCALFIQLQNKL